MTSLPKFICISDYFGDALKLFKQTSLTYFSIHKLSAVNPPLDLAAKINLLHQANEKATIVLIAGGADIQIHIFKTAMETMIDFEEYIKTGVEMYVDWIKKLNIKNILICGVLLPIVERKYMQDSLCLYFGYKGCKEQTEKVKKFLSENPYIMDMATRMHFANLWNFTLKEYCIKNNWQFVDINEQFLKEGVIDKKYHHLTLINHSLLWEQTIWYWQKLLMLNDSDLKHPLNDKFITGKIVQLKNFRSKSE